MLHRSWTGVLALLVVTPALAQPGGPPPSGQANTPAAAAVTASAAMQQPEPGDRWTYDVKDDISGVLKVTRTDMITDVSSDAITVRTDAAGSRAGNVVYDRAWDVTRDGPFKYSPNDGTGVRLPLAPGAQWAFTIDVQNSQNGMTFRRTGTSKVVGRENITTKAGTFDAFVIETDFTGKNVQDPTLVNQTSSRTWFDPGIDHWVKRSIVLRQRGHVVSKTTLELTKYGRGKP
ncbi:MAG TPA: hypothetical protein VMC05_10895 [Xanthobacteraceae bacterium]|nr:hypothetical protein [Xanthobacteraceae bacterium]